MLHPSSYSSDCVRYYVGLRLQMHLSSLDGVAFLERIDWYVSKEAPTRLRPLPFLTLVP